MSGASILCANESARLSGFGISPTHIREVEGIVISVVSVSVLNHIIEGSVPGRYVCNNGDAWTGVLIGDDGEFRCVGNLSEQLAYRVALGRDIGRKRHNHRYVLKRT